MSDVLHISEAAGRPSVTFEHPRTLERDGRIPRARRNPNGHIYSEVGLELPRAMGVGRRPRRPRSFEELLGATL